MIEIFKYGRRDLSVELPSTSECLEINEPEHTMDKDRFIGKFLSALPDDKNKYTGIAIVVSDKTRLCGYPLYLPWLIEALERKGAEKENITFYIAYGLHRAQTDEECLDSYGNLYKDFHFVHHDCDDDRALTNPGTTQRGTSVVIRKDVMDSSLLITFGAISYHYFAGYGGGRKLLFPGLAGRKSIYFNHSLFLDRECGELAAGCQPGNLNDNPVADDLKEIDGLLPPKISIHGILNSHGEVCKLLIGKNYNDFVTACREYDSYYRSGIDKQYDMVVASSGGYPKDINFIQAHKSLHHAASFVKDGGILIMLSECIDGVGSDYFMQYLEMENFEKTFELLSENYEGNGGTALSMMAKTKRIKIYLLTSLNEQKCKILNVHKISEKDMQQIINDHSGTLSFIKNASLLVK